jgi:hypothetical protein
MVWLWIFLLPATLATLVPEKAVKVASWTAGIRYSSLRAGRFLGEDATAGSYLL